MHWLFILFTIYVFQDHSIEYGKRNSRGSMFRIVPKFKKEKALKKPSPQSGKFIRDWLVAAHWAEHVQKCEEVIPNIFFGQWISILSLGYVMAWFDDWITMALCYVSKVRTDSTPGRHQTRQQQKSWAPAPRVQSSGLTCQLTDDPPERGLVERVLTSDIFQARPTDNTHCPLLIILVPHPEQGEPTPGVAKLRPTMKSK